MALKAVDQATMGSIMFVIAHHLPIIRQADLILVIVAGELGGRETDRLNRHLLPTLQVSKTLIDT